VLLEKERRLLRPLNIFRELKDKVFQCRKSPKTLEEKKLLSIFQEMFESRKCINFKSFSFERSKNERWLGFIKQRYENYFKYQISFLCCSFQQFLGIYFETQGMYLRGLYLRFEKNLLKFDIEHFTRKNHKNQLNDISFKLMKQGKRFKFSFLN